jgi:hypothetical protein
MLDTITVRERFPSRDDAEAARERLKYSGFGRDRMAITRIGDNYELAIHTSPDNRDRVQDYIKSSDMMFQARRYAREMREYGPSGRQSALLLGVIAAIGAGLYYAYTRRRDLYAQTYPSGERSAVRKLYRAHRQPSMAQERRPDCDLPENSQENLNDKLDHALKETFPTSDPVSVSITS